MAEIQQTSNITYRIYDYKSVDPQTGQRRELHTEPALDAINFELFDHYKTNYSLNINESNILVHSPFFKTNIIKVEGSMLSDYSTIDSFVIYICLNGSAKIATNNGIFNLQKGETILLPAKLKKTNILSNEAEIIEVYMF